MASRVSRSEVMLYRSSIARVVWPVTAITTVSGVPERDHVARGGAAEVVYLAAGHHHRLPGAHLGLRLDTGGETSRGPRLPDVAHRPP